MTLETESQLLRKIPLFQGLDNSKRKLVAMSSDRLVYRPGDIVFAQGARSDSVYFMLSGRVRVSREGSGETLDLAELDGGAVLGEIGVICGKARTASIVAVEESTMLRIDANVFKELLLQVPQVTLALARELASRLEYASDRLFAQSLANPQGDG